MKTIVVFAAVATLGVAQEQSRQTIMLQSAGEPGHMRVRVDAEPGMGNAVFNRDVVVTTDAVKMGFVAAEMSMGGKILKGAPYSADTVSETIQTLADGNRIVRKSTGAVYRDSEGRTRREQTIESIGPWSTSGEPLKSVTITDPVSAATYFLDSRAKEAQQIQWLGYRD